MVFGRYMKTLYCRCCHRLIFFFVIVEMSDRSELTINIGEAFAFQYKLKKTTV